MSGFFNVESCMKIKLTPCSCDDTTTTFEWELNALTNDRLTELKLLGNAVKSGDEAEVKTLLEQLRPRLNCRAGGIILWDAVSKDEIEIASMLVDAGADLKVTKPLDRREPSFLHVLVESKDPRHHQLAVKMMKHGADVNARDDYSISVLQHAIQSVSAVDLIKELLHHGANLNSFLIIIKAARLYNSNELTILLVDKFIKVEARVERVEDLLLYCGCKIHVESNILPIVRVLLNENLSVAEIDKHRCILVGAIHSGKIQMVKLLIEYGFDVNARALENVSPLYELSDCELPLHVTSSGESPLYAASVSNRADITELLIQAGAKVNDPSSYSIYYKGYAIHAACGTGSTENIRLLLRHGADLKVVDSRGRTPFSMIKFTGVVTEAHRLVIKHLALLIGKGKTINERDLQIIQNCPEIRACYTRCLDELEKMKTTKIINDVSFFSILEKTERKLSFMIRSDDSVISYNSVNRNDVFPNYHESMDLLFENARTRRELLRDKEEAICESLKYDLAIIPMERVIYYLYSNDSE